MAVCVDIDLRASLIHDSTGRRPPPRLFRAGLLAPTASSWMRAHPWIAFTTATGTEIRFQQNGHLSAPAGTQVTVAYEAHDPQGTARVHSFWAD